MLQNHLVIIGMPRSGTTWLHQRLQPHSRIVCALGRIREVHYFDRVHADQIVEPQIDDPRSPKHQVKRFAAFEARIARIDVVLDTLDEPRQTEMRTERQRLRHFIDHFGESDQWYAGLFDAGADDWCLDSTPAYYRLPEQGLRHMLSVADQSRYILLLRDPYRRAISGIQNRVRLHDLDWDGWGENRRGALCREVLADGQAVADIARLRRLIPAEELRIVFFEEMIADPEASLRAILDFVGLNFEPGCLDDAEAAPNPSPPIALAGDIKAMIVAETRATVEGLRKLGLSIPPQWDAMPDDLRPA